MIASSRGSALVIIITVMSTEQDKHLEGVLVLKTKVVELQRAKSQDLGTCTLTMMSMMIILTIVVLWKLLCWQFPLASFLLLSMTKTWHMLRVFGIRKGALVELLHDFFRSLQKISGYANTDISDIFRILYNIFGQQILPVDGRKGRPLSPKNKIYCLL